MHIPRRAAWALAVGAAAVAAIGAPVMAEIGAPNGPEPATGEASGSPDAVVEQLADAPADQPLRVFVHGTDAADVAAAAVDAGLVVQETFDRVAVAAAVGLPAEVASLADDARVTSLEADGELEYFLDTSHEATRGAEVIEGFDITTTVDSDSAGGPPAGHDAGGNGRPPAHSNAVGNRDGAPETATTEHRYTGEGVSIAILDSGIDATHPFFQDAEGNSRVAVNLDLVCHNIVSTLADTPDEGGPADGCEPAWVPVDDSDSNSAGGHGTHVAGIAGGSITELSDGRTIMGAAPDSTLIGLGAGAGLAIYGSASGLNWILEHHADPCGDGSCPPIKVVNNSWGSGGADHDPESVNAKLVNALVDEGVVVVFAAGNDGGDGSTNNVGPDALNPTPGVLAVANYDDGGTGTRDGALDSTSSRGEKGRVSTYPDISAPGANILSSCRLYLPVCGTGLDFVENGDYNTISGTSMAAPHIAGIVAQMFEAAAANDVALTPAMVEDALEDTAHAFATGGDYEYDASNPDTGFSYDKGHGLVDVVAAVTAVVGGSAPDATNECSTDGPVIVDAEGDATSYLGQATPMENQGNLDIVSGTVVELDTDDDGAEDALAFQLRLSALEEDPPTGSTGEYFDWNVTLGGAGFYVGLGWDRTEEEPSFVVGDFGSDTGTRRTLATIDGAYGFDGDIIAAILPYGLLNEATEGALPVIADGSVIGGHEIISRYQQGVIVPDADHATGACPYTVGLGAVPPPSDDSGPPPPPEPGLPDGDPDASIEPGEAHTFEAGPATAVNEHSLGAPGVGVTGDATDSYTVDLLVPTEATVTIDAVSSEAEIQDIDIAVFDQSGSEVASSGNAGGIESAEFTTPFTQRITIEVYRYTTVEASYSLTVALAG